MTLLVKPVVNLSFLKVNDIGFCGVRLYSLVDRYLNSYNNKISVLDWWGEENICQCMGKMINAYTNLVRKF
jgi:hypothetical protein